MLARTSALILALLCAAVVFSAPGFAEEVTGHVYHPGGGDPDGFFTPGEDIGIAGEVVRIYSVPGDGPLPPEPTPYFEGVAVTDPDGSYMFDVPPGTYQVDLPLEPSVIIFEPRVVNMGMAEPVAPEPSGFAVPTVGSPNTVVDIPILGGSSPVFGRADTDPDTIVGGIVADGNATALAGTGIESRSSYVLEGGQFLLQDVEITITYPGFAELITPGTSGPPGDEYFVSSAIPTGVIATVSIDPNQPALEGWVLTTPASVFRAYDGVNPIDVVEFKVRPSMCIPGHVFLDADPANGVFDGDDLALGGVTVQLIDVTDPLVVTDEVMTDPDGSFLFMGVPAGVFIVRAYSSGGVLVQTARLVERLFAAVPKTISPDADLAFPCDDPPTVLCGEGPLHSAVVKTSFFVGEDDSFCISARLKETSGHHRLIDRVHVSYDGGFAGPETSLDGALSIVDVEVSDGVATVCLEVTAALDLFPAGFFGDTERRIEVSLGDTTNVGMVVLDRAHVWPGAMFTWDEDACGQTPECGDEVVVPESCPDEDAPRFTVASTLGWDIWRFCHPAECVEQSTDTTGGVNSMEIEVDFRVRRVKGAHEFSATLRCGCAGSDHVHLEFPGDGWAGGLDDGALTLLRVWKMDDDGHWRARLRLEAPDRADGNPGALRSHGCQLHAELNHAQANAQLRLAGLELGPVYASHHGKGKMLYSVIAFQNAVDAAACRVAD